MYRRCPLTHAFWVSDIDSTTPEWVNQQSIVGILVIRALPLSQSLSFLCPRNTRREERNGNGKKKRDGTEIFEKKKIA